MGSGTNPFGLVCRDSGQTNEKCGDTVYEQGERLAAVWAGSRVGSGCARAVGFLAL